MANFVIPTSKSVESLLGLMYGDEIEVSAANSEPAGDHHIATYICDEDKLVATCACDDAFVVFSGAALSMVPAAVAEEMISGKEFNETVLDNFHEVMNICSRLLMSERSPHLRLDKTLPPNAANEVNSNMDQEAVAAGFDVKIPAYGSGRLVFKIS